MSKFLQFFEDKFVPIAAKIGGQKHLLAVRDAFAGLMPLVLAGALAVMLNNVFFVPWSLLAGFIGAEHPFIVWANTNVAPLFSLMESGTLSILALGLVFALAYNRANYEKQDALSTGLVSVGAFILLGALSRNNEIASSWVTNFLGAQGIFIAMIVGLVTAEIYFWVVNKNWVIKMPEMVPPAVSRGFSAVIPGFLALLFWGIIGYLFNRFAGVSLLTWFENTISNALLGLGKSVFSVLIISILIPLFWFFGLHGANMVEAVRSPIYGTLANINIDLFQNGVREVGNGANQLAPWVSGSWDIYVFAGGSGATLALLIAIFIASKRQQDRDMAKLSFPSGIFMINEPVLFGLPVVLNPIYFIPFAISQPILALIGYVATITGFAGPVVNGFPWTTPPVLNAFLATNGSIGAMIISALNIVVAFLIYLPFVLLANKTKDEVTE